jgi:hypothetical protein
VITGPLRVAAATAVFAVLVGLPACAQDTQEWHGTFGGGPNPMTRVARNSSEWSALWALLAVAQPAQLPVDAIGVEISLGLRNTGGYSVRIVSAEAEAKVFVVIWQEITPRPGALTMQALTDPYVVRIIPLTSLPVVFRKTP